MNPQSLIPANQMDDVFPFLFVMLLASWLVVPSVTLTLARRWSREQPQIAGPALFGAVAISLVGMAISAFLALAVVGWVPPLSVLLQS